MTDAPEPPYQKWPLESVPEVAKQTCNTTTSRVLSCAPVHFLSHEKIVGTKKITMPSPLGCPKNKQLFSQKSQYYSQILFLLCPLQGPPVWESCGWGAKNNINSVERKVLKNMQCTIKD